MLKLCQIQSWREKRKEKERIVCALISSYTFFLESDIGLNKTIVNPSLCEVNYMSVIVTLLREII